MYLVPCAGVTLPVNIDLTDRLASGQLGILYNIPHTESQISKIYVKFDDPLVGNHLMGNDIYCNLHEIVPGGRVESHISLSIKNNLHVIRRTQFLFS